MVKSVNRFRSAPRRRLQPGGVAGAGAGSAAAPGEEGLRVAGGEDRGVRRMVRRMVGGGVEWGWGGGVGVCHSGIFVTWVKGQGHIKRFSLSILTNVFLQGTLLVNSLLRKQNNTQNKIQRRHRFFLFFFLFFFFFFLDFPALLSGAMFQP